MNDDHDNLICARCLAELIPGHGNFFVVKIEGVADPFSPRLPDLSLDEVRREMERTLRQLTTTSAGEAQQQVRRHVTVHLCQTCFAVWIENPAGT